ncbi:MAG: biopolymer transporter ExbD [Planctomycetes bacterium]|nr:biopolymer transporter ExbD [Planctomycetota bacterium]
MKRAPSCSSDSILAALNMTPMIDVVFQLLIFFMVGMQIRIPGGLLNAYLPKERGRIPPQEPASFPPELRIRLERDPASTTASAKVNVFFQQYPCVDIQDLEDKLLRLGEEVAAVPVVIDGKADVPFRFVLGAMNACVKARFTRILFRAPPSE